MGRPTYFILFFCGFTFLRFTFCCLTKLSTRLVVGSDVLVFVEPVNCVVFGCGVLALAKDGQTIYMFRFRRLGFGLFLAFSFPA